MEQKNIPTDVLEGEIDSILQSLKQRVSITLKQGDENYSLSIPLGSYWKTESSARLLADRLWDKLLEPALVLHAHHLMAELAQRREPSSDPAPPG